jgi:hypothetical protein
MKVLGACLVLVAGLAGCAGGSGDDWQGGLSLQLPGWNEHLMFTGDWLEIGVMPWGDAATVPAGAFQWDCSFGCAATGLQTAFTLEGMERDAWVRVTMDDGQGHMLVRQHNFTYGPMPTIAVDYRGTDPDVWLEFDDFRHGSIQFRERIGEVPTSWRASGLGEPHRLILRTFPCESGWQGCSVIDYYGEGGDHRAGNYMRYPVIDYGSHVAITVDEAGAPFYRVLPAPGT